MSCIVDVTNVEAIGDSDQSARVSCEPVELAHTIAALKLAQWTATRPFPSQDILHMYPYYVS